MVNYASPRGFAKGKHNHIDAFLLFVEAGSAWTIIFTLFNVVVPKNTLIKINCAYSTPKDAGWI